MNPSQTTALHGGGTASRRKTFWGGLLALGGVELLVFSQVMCFMDTLWPMALPRLFAFRGGGVVLLSAGLLFLLQNGALPWFAGRGPLETGPSPRLSRARILAGLAGLIFAVLAGLLAGKDWKAIAPIASALAWLAGIALVAWAGWQGAFTRAKAPRWFWLAGVVIFAAALLLRLVSLETIPVMFTGDESGFGKVALQILRGETTNLFSAPYMGATNFPFLYDLIQAGALAVFGRSAWALRVTSALAGALTVLAVIYFGLRWFGRRTAIFAGLILAANHLHLHFSRNALNNVFDGLFFVLALGLLWDAWDSGERKKYLLAGLALGFSQYFYSSARVLPVAAIAFFMAAFVLDRRRVKANRVSIAFFWAAFLAVFIPMIVYYAQMPYTLFSSWSRVGQDTVKANGLLSAFSPGQLPETLAQLYRGLLGFTVLPLQWLYKPGVAILRPLPALLFLAGTAALLARRKWSQIVLLSLWLAAFGFIGGLSDTTPAAQRYVAAVPVLALLAGYGLASLTDVMRKIFRARAGRVALGLAVALALFVSVDDARFYFLRYTPRERYSDPLGLAVQRLTDYLRSKDGSTEVVFAGYPYMGYSSIPTLEFLNPQITRVVSANDFAELIATLQQPAAHRVYFFRMGLRADLDYVMRMQPGGRLTSEENWYHEPVYWIYETGP